MMEKRYTWIVRFDVVPEWVADGFVIDDERANDMLQTALPMAAEQHEIRAAVIGAPCPYDIAREQGYIQHPDELRCNAPLASHADPRNVDQAIERAIAFIGAIDHDPMIADMHKASLAELRAALAMIRGDDDLPLIN